MPETDRDRAVAESAGQGVSLSDETIERIARRAAQLTVRRLARTLFLFFFLGALLMGGLGWALWTYYPEMEKRLTKAIEATQKAIVEQAAKQQ
jgi:hypothetical protein